MSSGSNERNAKKVAVVQAVSTASRQTTGHPDNMSFDGSSKYDELSLSMARLRVPEVYKVTAFNMLENVITAVRGVRSKRSKHRNNT